MGKSRHTRIKDTVQYIEGCQRAGLTGAILQDIAQLVDQRYPRVQTPDKTKYNELSDTLSVKSKIGTGVSKGTSGEREMRRAITLLWSVLAATQGDRAKLESRLKLGMTLAPDALPAALDEVLLKAAVVASAAGASHVFNMKLSGDPISFIQTYRIFISGTTKGKEKFNNAAATDSRNVLKFNFCYNAEKDHFEFGTSTSPNHGAVHSFDAVSVPALHWSEVPGRGEIQVPQPADNVGFANLRGTALDGAAWMLTTQFTGCSFCYVGNANILYAAHLSPALNGIKIPGTSRDYPVLAADVLADQLAGKVGSVAGGRMSNYPGGGGGRFNVFGNGAGNAQVISGNPFYPAKVSNAGAGEMKWMSIFGRKDAHGNWELYSQSVDGVGAILEARRIL